MCLFYEAPAKMRQQGKKTIKLDDSECKVILVECTPTAAPVKRQSHSRSVHFNLPPIEQEKHVSNAKCMAKRTGKTEISSDSSPNRVSNSNGHYRSRERERRRDRNHHRHRNIQPGRLLLFNIL